jgi:Family of unknown function (DUF6510)
MEAGNGRSEPAARPDPDERPEPAARPDERHLDGNALGGALRQVFAADMTGALTRCAACGRVAELGAQHLYRSPHAPGAVLRCAACESVLLVLVERWGVYRLNLCGLSWLEVEA